jgi:hypothetical protein
MRNIKISIIVLITILFASLKSYSYQHMTSDGNSVDTMRAETLKALEKMIISFKGQTSQGNKYDLYAVKIKKEWVFLIVDSINIYSMNFDKKTEELNENPASNTDAITLAVRAGSVILKNKAKTMADIDLNCYYKMKSKAAKMYGSVKKMNAKAKDLKKGYKAQKSQIKKGKSDAKKVKNAPKDVKKEIKDGKGEIKDLKKDLKIK